jgi:predicted amidophosphoribosyltransferase
MAMTAFCTTCQRTVYVEEGHTPICPVCSTPLVETVEAPEDDTDKAV